VPESIPRGFPASAIPALVLLAIFIAGSCSSQSMQPPKWPDASPCVNKFAGEEARENLEQIIDRSSVHKTGPLNTELIRTTCDKQVYRRGDYLIIIYSLPAATSYRGDPRLAVRGYAEPVPPDQTPAGSMACLAHAKTDLRAIAPGERTLDAYDQKFALPKIPMSDRRIT
jgi:hypothetical protein